MAKPKLTGTFSTDSKLFDDLEKYLEFCANNGYKFDEATLYDMRSYVFQQFSKFNSGKKFKDQWSEDARKFHLADIAV
jgi:hypothetical protein